MYKCRISSLKAEIREVEEILVSSGVLRKKDERIEETVGQVGVHSGQDLGNPFSYWCGDGGGRS